MRDWSHLVCSGGIANEIDHVEIPIAHPVRDRIARSPGIGKRSNYQ
jgi:hypothetical protein